MPSKQGFTTYFLLITSASSLIVGSALFSEYVLGMIPCELCLIQRLGHYFAIPLAGIGFISTLFAPVGLRKYLVSILSLGVLLALGLSLYWAGFHVGVEQKWWEGLATCGGNTSANLSIIELMQTEFVPCDRPTIIFRWFFGGLSMATVHAILLLPLVATSFWGFGRSLSAFKN